MGHVFADMLSFANTKQGVEPAPMALLNNVYAIRGKLKSSEGHKRFIDYELGFRGSWPKQHYDELHMLQLELNSWLCVFLI
jgi:hypothetical protein